MNSDLALLISGLAYMIGMFALVTMAYFHKETK